MHWMSRIHLIDEPTLAHRDISPTDGPAVVHSSCAYKMLAGFQLVANVGFFVGYLGEPEALPH
jgi:hypothetical protein